MAIDLDAIKVWRRDHHSNFDSVPAAAESAMDALIGEVDRLRAIVASGAPAGRFWPTEAGRAVGAQALERFDHEPAVERLLAGTHGAGGSTPAQWREQGRPGGGEL